MKILVTGAKGFIGRNLINYFRNQGFNDILEFDKGDNYQKLDTYCSQADIVYHLAGENRPKNDNDFEKVNHMFTADLIRCLIDNNNDCPVVFSSSTQAATDNAYGMSKRKAEDALLQYSKKYDVKVYIYRFSNVFGKWARPNYNSFIATFAYNLWRGLPIEVINGDKVLSLIYIDDLVSELFNIAKGSSNSSGFLEILLKYERSIIQVYNLLIKFKNSRETLSIPNLNDEFEKKLYSTFLSYIPEEKIMYPLQTHEDIRGSFTEFIKGIDIGQISVNISKKNIIKGEHWHDTKVEKFLIVKGTAKIKFRNLNDNRITSLVVSDQKLEVIDIPPGFIHTLENIGEEDLVTIIWANEPYDSKKPDTYFQKIERHD